MSLLAIRFQPVAGTGAIYLVAVSRLDNVIEYWIYVRTIDIWIAGACELSFCNGYAGTLMIGHWGDYLVVDACRRK